MSRRKKWKVSLLSGQAAALALLGAFFFAGSVVGCVAAGGVGDPSGHLIDYIQRYLASLAQDGITSGFLSVF